MSWTLPDSNWAADPLVVETRRVVFDAFKAGLDQDLASEAMLDEGTPARLIWIDRFGLRNEFAVGIFVPNSRGRRAWSMSVNGREGRILERLEVAAAPAEILWRRALVVGQDEVVDFASWLGRVASARGRPGATPPAPPAEVSGDDLGQLMVASGHRQYHTEHGWASWFANWS